jgi:glucose dehydrogenase
MRRATPRWALGFWAVVLGGLFWWVVAGLAVLAGFYALWLRCMEAWE